MVSPFPALLVELRKPAVARRGQLTRVAVHVTQTRRPRPVGQGPQLKLYGLVVGPPDEGLHGDEVIEAGDAAAAPLELLDRASDQRLTGSLVEPQRERP
jgi:hypothetical protein